MMRLSEIILALIIVGLIVSTGYANYLICHSQWWWLVGTECGWFSLFD